MTRTLPLLLLLCGCPLTPELPKLHKPAATCSNACANLTARRCIGFMGAPGDDDTFGTDDDVPCADTCEDYMDSLPNPQSAKLELGCLSASESCGDVETCFEDWEGGR